MKKFIKHKRTISSTLHGTNSHKTDFVKFLAIFEENNTNMGQTNSGRKSKKYKDLKTHMFFVCGLHKHNKNLQPSHYQRVPCVRVIYALLVFQKTVKSLLLVKCFAKKGHGESCHFLRAENDTASLTSSAATCPETV